MFSAIRIEHELQKIDVIAQVRCWLTAEVRLLCTDQLFFLWYVYQLVRFLWTLVIRSTVVNLISIRMCTFSYAY